VQGRAAGLGLLNADHFRQPYGAPAIQLSSAARDTVLAAAAQRTPARLVATSRRTTARARNIVVTISGADRAKPPVVVMTPRSSWWQSTAERGGGLVCWLESLRALLAAPPLCNVIFTANTATSWGTSASTTSSPAVPGGNGRSRRAEPSGSIRANIGAAGGDLAINVDNRRSAHPCRAELARAGRPTDRITPKTLVPAARRATSTMPAGAI